MPHVLPPIGHPAREMFDVADLVAHRAAAQPQVLWAARRAALAFLAANPAARRVVSFVLRGNDELQLVSFGPRGGHKIEWRFGKW